MYDCHVHSSFSGDSNMDPKIAINTAMKLGFEGISFTDHLDIDYPDYDDVFMIDFDNILRPWTGLSGIIPAKSKFSKVLK